jgi:hypothetical protein
MVTIELSSYRIKNSSASTKTEIDNLPERSSPLYIYSGRSETVYIPRTPVDFKWSSEGRTDVYCEIDGSKAIFMEREVGGYYNYEFDNQTGYTIRVSMNQPLSAYYASDSPKIFSEAIDAK